MASPWPIIHLSPLFLPSSHSFRLGSRIHTLLWSDSPPFLTIHLLAFHRIIAIRFNYRVFCHRSTLRSQWCRRLFDRVPRFSRSSPRCGTRSFHATRRKRSIGIWILLWCTSTPSSSFPAQRTKEGEVRDKRLTQLHIGIQSRLFPSLPPPIRHSIFASSSSHSHSDKFPGHFPRKHPLSLRFDLLHLHYFPGLQCSTFLA